MDCFDRIYATTRIKLIDFNPIEVRDSSIYGKMRLVLQRCGGK
jgi:hypothetical protein